MDITIIGAGNMGRGIGTRAVAGGHSVTFVDASPETAEKAAADVRASAMRNSATWWCLQCGTARTSNLPNNSAQNWLARS